MNYPASNLTFSACILVKQTIRLTKIYAKFIVRFVIFSRYWMFDGEGENANERLVGKDTFTLSQLLEKWRHTW